MDEIERGRQAQELLNNPLLDEAMKRCREELMQAWENTPARDADAREWLWKLNQASIRFEGILKGYVDTGKIAKNALKEKEKFRLIR